MKTSSLFILLIIIIPVFLGAGPLEPGLFPDRVEVFRREGGIRSHPPETMYEHVDGEAELFKRYGARVLFYALYTAESGSSLTVDLLDCGLAENAFGLYRLYTGCELDTKETDIGGGRMVGGVPSAFAVFGPFFVKLSAQGPEPGRGNGRRTMKRRDFLRSMLFAAGGAVISSRASLAGEKTMPGMPWRVLGRTGMKVSAVSFGAMQCPDPAVIRYAVDRGVNFIDTADCYMGGQNEKAVGQAVAGIREKVFLATKVHIADEGSMRESVERSLTSIKTDVIDLMQLHGIGSRGEVENETAKDALAKMKKEGRIRFAGVTTHGGQEEVLDAVAEDGFYDTVLAACSFLSPPSLWEKIAAAAKRGVGVIAMKTQSGGYPGGSFPGLTSHQAALRFVLEKPGVVNAIPGMYSPQMVDENLAAFSGSRAAGALLLELRNRELSNRACAFCGTCARTCRRAKGGMEAARVAMYLSGYRDETLARREAGTAREALARCASCAGCTAGCPQGIDIPAGAKRGMALLS